MRIVILTSVLLALLSSPLSARTWHYAFWSDDPGKYLQAIRSHPAPATSPYSSFPRAGIVTHHFLAHRLMVDFFQCLKGCPSPQKILIIGPNHYLQGSFPISLSSLPWRTPFGALRADHLMVTRMKERLGLPEDPEAFSGEHSLGVLVPFIKFYFPDSEIVPLLLKPDAPEILVVGLADLLLEFLCQPGHFILLSMDFSHDCTAEEAEAADQEAQKVIASFQDSQALHLQVDCRNGLSALLYALGALDGIRVDFRDHSNSGILTGSREQTSVTSYFSILFSQRQVGNKGGQWLRGKRLGGCQSIPVDHPGSFSPLIEGPDAGLGSKAE